MDASSTLAASTILKVMKDILNNISSQSAEQLACAYYTSKGYNVSKPLDLALHYDLVIEKDKKYKSVNVKLAGLKSQKNPNSWAISANVRRRNRPSAEFKSRNLQKPDIYLVWLPKQQNFVEIDGGFFDLGGKSNHKLLPKNVRIQSKTN